MKPADRERARRRRRGARCRSCSTRWKRWTTCRRSTPAPILDDARLRATAKYATILGIDPGLRITGFGVIEKAGSKLAYVTSGCIRTDERRDLPERLKTILDGPARSDRSSTAACRSRSKRCSSTSIRNPRCCSARRAAPPSAPRCCSEPAGGGIHGAAGQAGGGRQWSCAQGTGAGNGEAPAAALPGDRRRDAADALACAICHAHGGLGLGPRDGGLSRCAAGGSV